MILGIPFEKFYHIKQKIQERQVDPMKIILLQDEKKLGKKGDIIEASEGYARNYILPKKIGVEASSKNLNDLKLHKANEEKVAQENLDAAKALATEPGDQAGRGQDQGRRGRKNLRFSYPPKRLQLPARNSMVSRLTRRKSSCRRV